MYIKMIFETFTNKGNVITNEPSQMYSVYSDLYECNYHNIIYEKNYTLSSKKLINLIDDKTDLILANQIVLLVIIKHLMNKPILDMGKMVLIDEAYIEFLDTEDLYYDSFIKYIDEYPNLIVTRTFQRFGRRL